jgi:hypothetical protein
MFEHWLHCYKIFEQDRNYLKHVYELTYEDYVANPDKYHQEIAAFIGTRVPEPPKEDSFRIVLQQWHPFGLRGYYRYIATKYESEFAKHGYSLNKGFVENQGALGSGKVSAILSPMYCFAADLGALLRRCAVRTNYYLRRLVKRFLPAFLLNRIRQARQRELLSKGAAEISALSDGVAKS